MVKQVEVMVPRLVTFLMFLLRCWTLEICDSCDCTVSELPTDTPGVRSIRLPCNEGSLDWVSPDGALRVELRFNEPKEFRACFMIDSRHTKIKVSQESLVNTKTKSTNLKPSAALKTLVIAAGKTTEYCINASNRVLLYLEPEAVKRLTGLSRVKFHYLLEKKTNKLENGIAAGCRPCDRDELIQAYCSSDFVVIGRVGYVTQHVDADRMEVGIHASHVVRQRDALFYKPHIKATKYYGKVMMHKNCNPEIYSRNFLFTGKIRFGEMVTTCAPYLSDWQKIAKEAIAEGRMECSLE